MFQIIIEHVAYFLSSSLSGETFFIFISLIIGAIAYLRTDKKVGAEQDAEYVRQVKHGDKDAYVYLFNKYSDDVYRYCYYFLSMRKEPEEDAKDAMREAFMKCLEHINNLREDGLFFSYLKRTAYTTCMDMLGDKQAFDEQFTGADASREIEMPDDAFQEGIKTIERDTPEKKAMTNEIQNDVKKAVNLLPENYRQAVILVHLMEYSYDEAAAMMGTKKSNIKTWVHRGIGKLADILKDYRESVS
ncbi:MAG: sigma-70 family RNA polymerase sigma factor [Proteobacteria bacterium]|nr:sigma-70 family RNA polymerase sigma factor [Pseudomonadota bacterium]